MGGEPVCAQCDPLHVVADEMGLGKTLTMLSLIVSSLKDDKRRNLPADKGEQPYKHVKVYILRCIHTSCIVMRHS